MALLRCYGCPGCIDSSLQLVCIAGTGVTTTPHGIRQVGQSSTYCVEMLISFSRRTSNWFAEPGIPVLDWPTNSLT